MRSSRPLLGFALVAHLSACGAARPVVDLATVPLIPRAALSDPQRSAGAISPDGKWVAYVAASNGVPNIFVARRETRDQVRAVTHDRGSGIRAFRFAYDNRHLLFTQDVDGDENDRVFATDLESGETRALTPLGARAEIDNVSAKVPEAILVNLNDRDPEHFDPVRIDIRTGELWRLANNDRYTGYVSDADLALRIASQLTDDGVKHWFLRDGDRWQPWSEVPAEDLITTGLGSFAADNTTLYLVDSRGRDTAGVFAIDLQTGARTLIDEDVHVDLKLGLVHPQTGRMQAIAHDYLRSEWRVLDPALAPDFAALRAIAGDGTIDVGSRTLDDRTWVVRISSPRGSEKTYFYDRATRRASLWFDGQPSWASLPLQPLHAVAIASRDGLTLPSYYMLPPGSDPDGDGVPERPVPMVLWIHGGPWDREVYGWKAIFQLYANRGYAVLAVNYRGSTGFGKAFVNASRLEWGGKMQLDLLDAKAWAVAKRIARADKVAAVGGSYGGYAVLAGMTLTPDAFACGISVSGPSSLLTLLDAIPPYWTTTRALYTSRVGDPATEQGAALLRERSPLSHVDKIMRPLLIGQGANDPRVKQSEADQIVAAMQQRSIPVTYALFPDEGHGIQRTANQHAFSAVTEEFLGRCLGGRVQPVGNDFAGSSITVPVGAEQLPGVARALRAARR
jgi:dipeptidyl aminopeptidase/acylaminoacyl peptidase